MLQHTPCNRRQRCRPAAPLGCWACRGRRPPVLERARLGCGGTSIQRIHRCRGLWGACKRCKRLASPAVAALVGCAPDADGLAWRWPPSAGGRARVRQALGASLPGRSMRIDKERSGPAVLQAGACAARCICLCRILPAAWGPARIGTFSGRGENPHRRYAAPVASPRAPSLRKGRADQVQGLSRRLKSG